MPWGLLFMYSPRENLIHLYYIVIPILVIIFYYKMPDVFFQIWYLLFSFKDNFFSTSLKVFNDLGLRASFYTFILGRASNQIFLTGNLH